MIQINGNNNQIDGTILQSNIQAQIVQRPKITDRTIHTHGIISCAISPGLPRASVVDVVDCYDKHGAAEKTDLYHYDTKQLVDGDLVRVQQDELHNLATTFYRWHSENKMWTCDFIYGPFAESTYVDQSIEEHNLSEDSHPDIARVSANPRTQPTDPSLSSIKIDNKVYKIVDGGGGSGNVDDVLQNGKSVVDENKIARVVVPTKTSDLTNDSQFISEIDSITLKMVEGVLAVNTTDDAIADNTQPITSSGVNTIVGNINVLLSQI